MIRKITSSILILLVVVSSFLPTLVYADTSTIYPNNNGSVSSLYNTVNNHTNNYTYVDEVVADDNVSYVINNDTTAGYHEYKYDVYNFQDFGSGFSSISDVTVYWRGKYDFIAGAQGDEKGKPLIYIGAPYYGTEVTLTTSWANYSTSWGAINPATGVGWTDSDLDNMQVGIAVTGTFTDTVHRGHGMCTQVYVIITYVAAVLPSVTTDAVITYSATTATSSGQITATGGATVTDYGFVWDTSDKGDPGNAAPADGIGGWTKGWSIGAGVYPVGTYTHAIAGLTAGQTYFIRFAAKNSVGWEYASAVSFTTIANPSITTVAASSIAGTTGRINSSVVSDGGEACTVEFIWVTGVGPYANYAAISADGGHAHVIATGTYTTGNSPYYDLTGLTVTPPANPYWFCASITNAASTQYGTPLSFSTTSGIDPPLSFKAVAGSTTINLIWVKGIGSTSTYIRYKTGAYPANDADGTLINSTEATYEITGLTMGTTYYFKAWGLSGTLSGTSITTMCTTLAAVSGTGSMPTISAPAGWFTISDPTVFSNLPIYGTVNWVFDAYEVPRASGWFTIAIILALMGGIGVYTFSHKILIALFAEVGFMVMLSFMGMIPLFLVFIIAAFAVGALVIGQRV